MAGIVRPGMFALVGPTATGKTEAAIRLARCSGCEIVCADAMTIWRGLDVGTAKPSPQQRVAVPHHLVDIADPGSRPSVANIAEAARQAIQEIRQRGAIPLVVGGSGLYMRAILDDLDFPPTDPVLRDELESLAPDELARRLLELDPDSGSYLDLRNRRRVVRALEITLLTGAPASAQREAWNSRAEVPVAGLDLQDALLEARIRRRTDAMLEAGWLEEARAFDDEGRRAEVLATQATGYREMFALLDGTITPGEARERIVRATLQLAKRQRRWFRADPRVRWIDAEDPERADAAIAEKFDASTAAQRHT